MRRAKAAHIKQDTFFDSEAEVDEMMNLNLRQAIIQRVHDKTDEELYDVIEDSIGGAEQLLPGLGVLFEIIWENTDKSVQNTLVHTLKEHLASK